MNNTKNITIRESNFELMRIISMIFIIIFHMYIHGNILDNSDLGTKTLLIILESIIIIHVNSFIIATGYFQSEKKIKISKFFSLNDSVWFYKTIFILIFIKFGLANPNTIDFIKIIIPINYMQYWFVAIYLILYLVSPIINIVIKNTNKKQHLCILCILFLVFSILSTVTRQVAFNNNRGYSLANFIFLYFIGGYLKKYPIEHNMIFSHLSTNLRKVIFAALFFLLAFFNVTIYIFGSELVKIDSTVFQEFGYIFLDSFTSYCSPIVILQTISYFLFFRELKIRNRIINKISSCTFGIYLIHENNQISSVLYDKIGLLSKHTYHYNLIPKILIIAICIFLVCWVIDYVRQTIFKLIYKTKIIKKIRKKIKKDFNSLKFNAVENISS